MHLSIIWAWITRQLMPLIMKTVRRSYAILPLFKSFAFAGVANHQGTKKIIAFTQIHVPHGKYQRLLIQVIRSCFEAELFVEHRI